MGTKFWGPIGWLTLHSVSAIYPETPSQDDRAILEKFVELFRETMTCIHCKNHFTSILNTYRRNHPEWTSSRYHFFLFVCRAHNTVNRRLDKPVIQTLQDCITTLKSATSVNSASVYRTAYINYLLQNWSKEFSGDGAINLGFVKRMKQINDEYFTPRDKGFESVYFFENGSVVEFIPEDPSRYNAGQNLPNAVFLPQVRIGFKNGKLRIGGQR